MSLKIAVIADLHASSEPTAQTERRSDLATILLRRSLELLKIRGDIDLILLAGDLVDSPNDLAMLQQLREITENAPCPVLAIPGNHNPRPDLFYTVFNRIDYLDLNEFRIIPFPNDPETPGYNAVRKPTDLARAQRLCESFAGPKIYCQHVPLFPPKSAPLRYGYGNASIITSPLADWNVVGSISGHQHEGVPTLNQNGTTYLCAPALCESPFRFQIVTFSADGKAETETVALRLPESVGWIDRHTHTPLAYCNENVDPEIELLLMEALNLQAICVTEHSGQLYFHQEPYWQHRWFTPAPVELNKTGREEAYFAYLSKLDSRRFIRGTELDVDCSGNPLMTKSLKRETSFRIGAIHALSEPLSANAADQFLHLTGSLIRRGQIQVLAHPYRVFSWSGVERNPEKTYAPLVKLLKENQVAAEVNFHHNRPDPFFTRKCIEAGVKLSFGSDTHHLYELGFFNPHIEFIRSIGYDGDLTDILLPSRV